MVKHAITRFTLTPTFRMFGFSGVPARSPDHRSAVRCDSRLRDSKEIDHQEMFNQET
jgi:hypothetical protein